MCTVYLVLISYSVLFLPPAKVFQGQEYISVSSVSENVPVLSCGTISKRFFVPGWRLGWILIYDRNSAFERGKVNQRCSVL